LHPKLRDEALELYDDIVASLTGSAICRFAYTLRTFAEQDALFAQGRTKPGNRVTNAKGGQSYHNYGLAIDIVLILDKDKNGTFETASWDVKSDFDGDKKADWMEVVQIFKRFGFEWGGDWKFVDAPHFQKTFGKSIYELKSLHAAGKVDKNGFVLI
jgi:peptidoglycan L-alanyl-D-glutamate endopeptidase CwlK